jgi:hypothetical protein
MFDMTDRAAFWLNVTNLALGLLVLVCWVLVTVGVVRALADRRKRRLAPILPLQDRHFAPGLGATMADGGEPVADTKPAKHDGTTT